MEGRIPEDNDLRNRWKALDGIKRPILNWSYDYADWTLPYIFPRDNSRNVELQLAKDSIGAQAVNHLANKVVSTLFPPQQLFFRLHVTEDIKQQVQQAMQMAAGLPTEEANAQLAQAMKEVEAQLASVEKQVVDALDMVQYRPQAVNAAKLLIVTGNALEYHPADGPVQVYNLKDYCVLRDLSGQVIEIMTLESKSFQTFSPEVQGLLRDRQRTGDVKRRSRNLRDYMDTSNVDVYTRIRLEDDGKFHVTQQADGVELDTTGAVYTRDKLPWIVLAWNLVRGEDYGRGLVQDYAGAFHAINTLSGSLLNIAAIMGDIKFLVNPTSLVDVQLLNDSPAGSYHPGRPEDVAAIQTNKNSDAQFIAMIIERYEKQIAQAFLLNSQLTRNAERVTAEEIRLQANELETSNGGIYSRLASSWQLPLAIVMLEQVGFDGLGYGVVPQVITGMDSLSRVSELDNIRMFLADMAMLDQIPEDVRAYIDVLGFAAIVGTARNVDYLKFMKTQAQVQQEQQALMQQQMQLQQQQANSEMQVAAGKEAMRG